MKTRITVRVTYVCNAHALEFDLVLLCFWKLDGRAFYHSLVL